MIELTFKTSNQKVNCPHCKGQNFLEKLFLRQEIQHKCIHCLKDFYIKSTPSIKHKIRKKKGGTKSTKSDHKKMIEYLDGLWSRAIIARAGFKSEITALGGDNFVLQAHHIYRKKNYYMRYLLENGICLTKNEHLFGIHSSDMNEVKEYEELVKTLRGHDIYETLAFKQKCNTKVDLFLIEKMLLQEIARLE